MNIALLESPAYPNGKRVFWGGTVDTIYKAAIVDGTLKMISSISRDGALLTNLKSPFSVGYTALRYDNVYLTSTRRAVLSYRDSNPADMNSSIVPHKKYEIPTSLVPESAAGSSPEQITGINVLFDGKIVIVTRNGYVGVVDIEAGRAKFRKMASGETVSNSIAVDKHGGIYVVSSKQLYRFQWDSGVNGNWDASTLKSSLLASDACASCWNEPYPVDANVAGKYSVGSGSTPTLMGPNGEYVVITDGAKVNNLTVYRTGALSSGQTRRAAAMPVTFGERNRAQTSSEQSVVVSGYGMAVISNDYRNLPSLEDGNFPLWFRVSVKPAIDAILAIPVMKNFVPAAVNLLAYGPNNQPYGVQKFSFDPATGKMKSDWHTLEISCGNAVPVVSETSRRFYCVGSKDWYWTIESLDWDYGYSPNTHFRKYLGLLPRYNPFYDTNQLTADGGFLFGSISGVVYLPPVR